MSNQKLVEKFEKIYKETYAKTLKYVICRCYNFNDVNDIIQETYLELYKVLKQKKKVVNYQSYIITIARNKIIKLGNLNKKIETINIFQGDEESVIDLELRNRYGIRNY